MRVEGQEEAPLSPTGSSSGWTMFQPPLKREGLPKTMYSRLGESLSWIHFTPLKNTRSMVPLSSRRVAIRRAPLPVPAVDVRIILPLSWI